MSDSPTNACSNPEVNSLVELSKQNKRVEFSSKLSEDLAAQSPAETLKFLQQLHGCLEQERPKYPNLPHLEIQQSAPPPNSQSI
ncbi:MAG: hypothetical protein P4L53_18135 [Candidatus Obscuribacterales bacterium]|nr:hypothetical protein [Candidatus Obscuribacterales bacterium]